MKKTVDQQTEKDFRKWPVWEFCEDKTMDETAMSPVKKMPVDDLRGRVVACDMVLANGQKVFGGISNISVKNLRKTQQFQLLAVFKNGKRFVLRRYFDVDIHNRRGPDELAKFLGFPVNEVFPISYDISKFVEAPEGIVKGQIHIEPIEKLSAEERRDLIFAK